MTNLNKLYTLYDVHSHKRAKVKDLLKNHLPSGYSKKVEKKLLDEGVIVPLQSIRQVKFGTFKNAVIFNAILEVAIENKKAKVKLQKTLENI
ncbi:hypothetical protein ACFFVB_18265 [Formosa undariae]|uniref:Uncharacterized protein n=1 Tax=Formosa undariae TaxID=1325436 RepID=A0ABV5F6F9_9FLAO